MRARIAAFAMVVCVCAAVAQQPAAPLYALKDGAITYVLVHKLHEVRGTSRKLEGLARIEPGGPTLVQVRVAVASFDSGNSNRDSHMREATHEAAHPAEVPLDARVELNGESERRTIPVTLTPEGSGIRAKFSFPVSLDAHHVERPELLLVKVDDKVTIEGNLLFEARQ